jgi:hypothetical protein
LYQPPETSPGPRYYYSGQASQNQFEWRKESHRFWDRKPWQQIGLLLGALHIFLQALLSGLQVQAALGVATNKSPDFAVPSEMIGLLSMEAPRSTVETTFF